MESEMTVEKDVVIVEEDEENDSPKFTRDIDREKQQQRKIKKTKDTKFIRDTDR